MSTLPKPVIRAFGTEDSLEALTELLHLAYAAHAAAGLRFFASYQTPADTNHRIRKGECWVAESAAGLVGTVTVVAPYDFPPGYPASPGAGTFYQLAVLPAYTGQGLGTRLLEVAEHRIRERGCQDVCMDTSVLATALVQWYEHRGYRRVGEWAWGVTNYPSVVLSKTLQRSGQPDRVETGAA